MKVLWLTPSYPYKADPVKGVFFKTQVSSLSSLSVDIDVLAPIPYVPWPMGIFNSKWQNYLKVSTHSAEGKVHIYRPRYISFPRENIFRTAHIFKTLAVFPYMFRKYDLLHAHFSYPEGLVAAQMSRVFSLPYVLTLHGSDVNVYAKISKKHREYFCSAIRGAETVVTVSSNLADTVYDITGVRAKVLPIGIHIIPPNLLQESSLIRSIAKGRKVVLFVGNLLKTKGVGELLDALAAINSDRIVGIFIGDGPMKDSVITSSLTEIIFLGVLQNDEVRKAMKSADVLVLPSYMEGMPTVIIEAGSALLPVIATKVGGIPEILDDSTGYLIDSLSSLEQVIKYVLENREEATEKAKVLYERIGSNYDVLHNSEYLKKIYESIVEDGKI
ncbi:glycosyltransferase family 4 protein [Deinococcus detaillensis]|uniref:Glycosyltransferase family 4 protein n=1 Tax=Deinococcus detaillensis TaxID=2592048 RepID=A0A553UMR5_9DEIO|nr:glycosyltransferase [Deinococcus detaillensis]TSA81465.1 glycosyltransferase family 4 protein [Deinococcus detaillensis]